MTDEAMNRYQRNAQARANAARKRNHANFVSLVMGLLLIAGLAVAYTVWQEGVEGLESLTNVGALTERFNAWFETPASQYNPQMDAYAEVARSFTVGELAPWKSIPEKLKPKNAPVGTVYHALVPRETGFDIYALKMGGVVEMLTPFGKPVPLTMADFKKSCDGKPYFMACFDRVFACGGDLKEMDARRKALLADVAP